MLPSLCALLKLHRHKLLCGLCQCMGVAGLLQKGAWFDDICVCLLASQVMMDVCNGHC